MKIKKQLFTLAAIALLMTACNKNDELAPEQNSTFPADGIIRVATNVTALQTRAEMTTESVKEFDIRIKNDANSAYTYHGVMVKELDVWESYTDVNRNTPMTMLWQNNTQKVKVAAVYSLHIIEPDEWDNGFRFYVMTDQSSEHNYWFSNIIYMKEKEIDPSQDLVGGKIPIVLKHRLSKLNLMVKMGTEFNKLGEGTASNLISNVRVAGTNTSVFLKIIEDTMSDYGTPAVINPWYNADAYIAGVGDTTQAEAKYQCILIPQTVGANTFKVSFKIGERYFSWTSPAEVVLAGGTQYDLTLNVGKDVVSIGGFTSIPWTVETPQDIVTD